ncbi:putative transcription elongation factor TFIIS [Armadillidium vulgare iridescent virus]|uniref:Putative transcription elongation factor TFIIS n=1 Tax=Armadillidium vulgare iridescent virus TaxID=72201 RepID=A0A068QL21_9VIRU|nr:putative transcription elongation factor TFIIS [Armadillidium vulgare iridescent virus]CCV02400.1 putative transcription elongation factor TFIIS [Armadillidium vulgare iridescent virus]
MDNLKNKIQIIKILSVYVKDKSLIPLFLTHINTTEDVFECVGLFEKNKKNDGIAQYVLKIIQEGNFKWNDNSLKEFLEIEKEEDDFLETPPDVAEGIFQCKCGCTKVYSMSKQTRGGDENTTVFAICTKCKSKWVVS